MDDKVINQKDKILIMEDSTHTHFAVELARRAIEEHVKRGEKIDPQEIPEEFMLKMGVFVTIYTYPEGNLRGCIGFSDPIYPLYQAIIEAAISATEDPRFEPLKEEELHKVTIEVSILTPPEPLEGDREDYLKKIKTGRDGLLVRKGSYSGLLLPQVAVEHDMDPIHFLEATCEKAGLPISAWTDPETEVSTFQSEVWAEGRPNGEATLKVKKS